MSFCTVAIAQTSGNTAVQYGKPYTKVPDRRDVALYQVNMRAFSKDGNFAGVTARLDSIKALGINMIYLMPIYPVGIVRTSNSPYCVRDYTAVNKEFGTLDDLRTLVAAAHAKGMAVMLDWVANHTSYDNPWTVNKSWYLQDASGNIVSPPGTGWNDVAQLNFKNSDMRMAMISAMKYWVLTANTDGFRCDYADGPPADFWKQAIDTLRNIPAHHLLFLAEGTHKDLYKAGFDFNFGFRFYETMKKVYAKGLTAKYIDSLNVSDYAGTTDGQQIVRYITNHDVNSSDGTPLDLFNGKKGSMAAFVVAACMKSVPMIYNGQEVATPYRLRFPFVTEKIQWGVNPDVTAEYKKIIAFRNNSLAVRRGELTSYTTDDICSFTKKAGSKKIFAIVNLRDKAVTFNVPGELQNTKWVNGITNSKTTINKQVTLQPYQYMLLKN